MAIDDVKWCIVGACAITSAMLVVRWTRPTPKHALEPEARGGLVLIAALAWPLVLPAFVLFYAARAIGRVIELYERAGAPR